MGYDAPLEDEHRHPPPGPRGDKEGKPPPPSWRAWVFPAAYLALTLALLWGWQEAFSQLAFRQIPYSEFKAHLARGEVEAVRVAEDRIQGRVALSESASEASEPAASGAESAEEDAAASVAARPGEFVFETIRVEDPGLVAELTAAGVRFEGVRPSALTQFLISWALPLGLMALFWIFLFRRMGAPGQQAMQFGRSRARLVADRETGVRFDDVAGADEAKHDLEEVVEFLRDPERYRALGARIPKGVLLLGPPGTGKTLMARAVAGEAGVPFFSLSGSEFVEMFVGVGAARVRDLFEQAKKHAPCIVFIDELDAIGRARGISMGQTHEEREQTLNQLLVEMDGFEANAGVILLAATNRPEVLDRALLRPGRFDRQVLLDAPNLDGRVAILEVHARGKPLADDVDLREVARATPGFAGADLANVMNEAALLAAREGATQIAQHHLNEAVERVVAGPERRSRRLSEDDKRRVAYHEMGHALVAAHSEHADPVHKITIVPRGRAALGYTLQLPTGEQYLLSRSALLDRVKSLLGGRAAEEIVLGEVSTGAENDLQQATNLVRQMVAMYGMGQAVRLAHCARPGGPQFLSDGTTALERDCSEATAREIDQEVIETLDAAYDEARAILEKHRDQLDRAAQVLIERETLEGSEFYELLGPEARRQAAATAGVFTRAGAE